MSSSTFLVAIKDKNKIFVFDNEGKIVNSYDKNQKILLCYKKRFGDFYRSAMDVLELFAFVKPACYVSPTIKDLATNLGLKKPETIKEQALSLYEITDKLLEIMEKTPQTVSIAKFMSANNWDFGEMVADKLYDLAPSKQGLNIFPILPDFKDAPPASKFGIEGVSEEEALKKLRSILPKTREIREQQEEYVKTISHAFSPKQEEGEPKITVIEAGTGTGKTLGYLAPSACYALKNNASVWISTYTKNLQQQLNREINYLFTNEEEKKKYVTVRKGRENYLCLLNFEELLSSANMMNYKIIGLMARWILKTEDGDLTGEGFPSWMFDIFDQNILNILSDRRFECLYSSCPHYRKCFIEKSIRKADSGTFVITNHALAMACATSGIDNNDNPNQLFYVFDEGHHIFNAADSTFSANLSLNSCSELRRWIIGLEDNQKRSRMKGLLKRTEKISALFPEVKDLVDLVIMRAGVLPKPMVLSRIKAGLDGGVVEQFFTILRNLVRARNAKSDEGYSLECEPIDLTSEMIGVTLKVIKEFNKILDATKALDESLDLLVANNGDTLEASDKMNIDSIRKTMKAKIIDTISTWSEMLNDLGREKRQGIIDFFEITKNQDGIEIDLSYQRRLIDPTIAFAGCFKESSAGIAVTSATLKDRSSDETYNEITAKRLSGAIHFKNIPEIKSIKSPFDYIKQTRIIIINDVDKTNIPHIAGAFYEIFKACGGGALGLFTSIRRLKAVYNIIRNKLTDAGIELLAQHVTPMTNSSLMDLFKSEEDSCLLGTDAMRDGVDIPGKSLRLVLFDRVPWEKPSIIHKVRREVFGKDFYDKSMVRMKLIQAYGRLIRKHDDKGVFVMLDKATPSSVLKAFPEGVEIHKIGLKDAVKMISEFLNEE